ncbi:MAG: alpha-xylosidase [Humibacillus sp.]|nr:alpha-xylosidase [Humibacillus sp.]
MRRPTLPSARRLRATTLGVAVGALTVVTALAGSGSSMAAQTGAADASRPAAGGVSPMRDAKTSSVTAGPARFEVLSPTLIRTEYAGDGHFEDAGTFNVVGRDAFPETEFTSTQADGWLTIATSRVTLRYRLGSGPFNDTNLDIALDAGPQAVTAAPWPAEVLCTVGVRCEAEDQKLSGPGLATDHSGYSGTGFVAGFSGTGDALGLTVVAATDGDYDVALRYANNRGGDGQLVTRTLTATVDGGAGRTLSLAPTASWDTWGVARVPVHLTAGRHTLSISRTAADTGNVNVDNIAVVSPGAAYPAPAPAPAPATCTYGALCESETGALAGGARKATDHDGYSGAGFLAGLERVGASDTLTVKGVPAAGTYALQLRYANYLAAGAGQQERSMSVTVNGSTTTSVDLPSTSSWRNWRTVGTKVTLAAGDNTIALGCPTASSCNVNLDTVAVTSTSAPLLAPHAPLGGYRRGLDNVDGEARTSPGLLYQDGWSLLDDTASALWDPRTETVTQRPAPSRQGYQDGYVFAYGQRYPTALQDLSTLTGSSKLMPRWTYGVWYSEYYDRTQSEFLAILDRARQEKMPLDVMIVDTDWKAGNTWNGWEVDTKKFPDVNGFIDTMHGQGVHTSFNIHPSISGDDPRYAQAQQTAGGSLQPGYCGGGAQDCHVFDWGDPKQLKSYLDLHQPVDSKLDFWWLDWCCDSSSASSLAGVTPDAWINQQYASKTAPRTERGFAFSRAYGSLQAGGYGNPTAVPTGPWADKRTTMHFTGDTISDWQTLQYEIGYTPGESVATGNASVTHDIGGHTGGERLPGAEPGSTQLSGPLYARWVQLGTFQPFQRLHSNHSDRLPWQYPAAAGASATTFLNLRERLVPYTYTLAREATATGTPIVRPLYLQYPGEQEAYANAGSEYLYGPDVLVAPVATPGDTATTSVWFPTGSTWTDWFTGKTYRGGTTAQITTDLSTMPVFIRSGGIVTTRTGDVANDSAKPLDAVTLTVGTGAAGSMSLYEDNGESADLTRSATTSIDYAENGPNHRLTIGRTEGTYAGQPTSRTWTATFVAADKPSVVQVDGHKLGVGAFTYDAAARTLTVTTPARQLKAKTVVSYR